MSTRRGARSAARGTVAAVLALTALTLMPGAHGASCAGVTAVADFGALGGGVVERCVPDGAGRSAWEVFNEAGFDLMAVQQFPDAVCRVNGRPASDPCVRMPPANAYWGLFWSAGSGWVYSTKGAQSLTVPAGGSLGLAWQSSSARRTPGAAPAPSAAAAPTRQPTAKAAPKPTAKATPKPAPATRPATPARPPAPTSGPSSRALPAAAASAPVPASATPSPTAAPAPVTTSPPAVATPKQSIQLDEASTSQTGLPWWVPVSLLLVLGGASTVVWRVRRARR